MTRKDLVESINYFFRLAYGHGQHTFLVLPGTSRPKAELENGRENMANALSYANQMIELRKKIAEEFPAVVEFMAKYHKSHPATNAYLFVDHNYANENSEAYRHYWMLERARDRLQDRWWEPK